MAKQQIIVLGLWLAALCGGCWNRSGNKENKQDEFYTVMGGWGDWIRIPLLKPYDLGKINPRDSISLWYATFEHTQGATDVRSVSVSVKDSVVYLMCGDRTIFDFKFAKAAWYVLDARTETEKSFGSEAEFNQHIKKHKYPKPQQWHDVDSLSEALGNNGGKLPWMPNK